MIPFCRTPEEADLVLEVMAEAGLSRGENGLEIYVMAEIPSNILLADELRRALRRLLDRLQRPDAAHPGHRPRLDDPGRACSTSSSPAVTRLISELIAKTAHDADRKVGLCGQAPSDNPALRPLPGRGWDRLDLGHPDTFVAVKREVAAAEAARKPSVTSA